MKKRSDSKAQQPTVQRRKNGVGVKRATSAKDWPHPASEAGVLPVLEDYDVSALSQAKTQWFFGEWDKLAAMNLSSIHQHPDRDSLALLVAASQQQLGQYAAANKSVRLAISWGCNTRLVAQILIAGVHNTLGRAAALASRESAAISHFKSAVSVGATASGSAELMGHARSVREIAKLGLLPQASMLMAQSLAKASEFNERPTQTQAHLEMLEVEIDLLRHMLILAAKRKQLFPTEMVRSTGGKPTDAVAENALNDVEGSTSQLGQDLWVLEQTGHKRGGYFVEFGATDGVLLSNTWLLEKKYGWTGLCAEPHPVFFAQLKANRSCQVSDACIAADSGQEVDFILADEYGTIASYAENDMHALKRKAFRDLGKTVKLRTLSLEELLLRHNAPREIDYLSIDTEGSEYDILRTFPFDRWRIRCITVEHNFSATREPIRRLLESLAYRRQESKWDDWYLLVDES